MAQPDTEVGELEQHFQQRSKENIVKFRNEMVAALKQQDWSEALDCANKVLLLDPNDAMTRSFQQLLQEKADLDDDGDDDDEDEDEDGEEDGQDAECAGEAAAVDSGDDPEDTEEEEETESEDEEDDVASSADADAEAAGTSSGSGQLPAVGAGTSKVVSGVSLDRSSCTTSSKQRAELRATLQADIKRLKEHVLISTMVADDPLLSA